MAKKAMSSKQASFIKKRGENDEEEFVRLINGTRIKGTNKRDIFDKQGNRHSIKGGEKKWQIFLYGTSRFEKDIIFKRLNGIGLILLDALNVFPDNFSEYQKNKIHFKKLLQPHMRKLCGILQNKQSLKAFLSKSIFNAGEVEYLTVKIYPNEFENCKEGYYIFFRDDVLDVFTKKIEVVNSKAKNKNELNDLKVIFKIDNKNFSEIEIRTDQKNYKRFMFRMDKKIAFLNLIENLKVKKLKDRLFVCGSASATFKG